MMERQISRIRAEADLRSLAIQSCSYSGEQAEKVHKVLIAEQGETFVIARSAIEAGEQGALAALKALM